MTQKQKDTKKTHSESSREAHTLPYDKLGFKVVKPKEIKYYKGLNKESHRQLTKECIDNDWRLWYGDLIEFNGRIGLSSLLIPDWDTFPDPELHLNKATQKKDEDELRCPFCKKKCSSTSGLTLHKKNKHADKF